MQTIDIPENLTALHQSAYPRLALGTAITRYSLCAIQGYHWKLYAICAIPI